MGAGRRRGLVLAGFIGVAASFLGGVAGARAEPEGARTGFDLFFDGAPHVLIQTAKGSVSSSFDISSEKENVSTVMYFRLGGGIRGPSLGTDGRSIRPVVWASALLPLNESSAIGTDFVESMGMGSERLEFSKYSIEYQTSALAGLGVEFLVPVLGIDLAVTPGIESLHLVGRYAGTARLESQQGLTEIEIDVRGQKEFTQHFLGPALRVGTPGAEVAGLRVDFWAEASWLFDVSGSRRIVGASEPGGDSARFSFETGSGAVQIGTGLSIRFP